MSLILKSNSYTDYKSKDFECKVRKGDIIKIKANRIDNNLSFIINDKDCGIAFSEIPPNDILYPIVILYNKDSSIEIVD